MTLEASECTRNSQNWWKRDKLRILNGYEMCIHGARRQRVEEKRAEKIKESRAYFNITSLKMTEIECYTIIWEQLYINCYLLDFTHRRKGAGSHWVDCMMKKNNIFSRKPWWAGYAYSSGKKRDELEFTRWGTESSAIFFATIEDREKINRCVARKNQ